MDPVLEAVARALHSRRCPHVDAGNPDACSFVPDKPNWTFQIEDARAVLSAIEAAGLKILGPEPTDAMIKAGAERLEIMADTIAPELDVAEFTFEDMWTAAPPRPVEER